MQPKIRVTETDIAYRTMFGVIACNGHVTPCKGSLNPLIKMTEGGVAIRPSTSRLSSDLAGPDVL